VAKHGVMAPGLWARLQSLPRHLDRWSSSEARRSEPSLKEADDAALSERGLSLWQFLEPLAVHFVVVDAVDAIFVVVAVVVQQLQLKLPTNFAIEVVVVQRLDSV
jgi:hypothetical protein